MKQDIWIGIDTSGECFTFPVTFDLRASNDYKKLQCLNWKNLFDIMPFFKADDKVKNLLRLILDEETQSKRTCEEFSPEKIKRAEGSTKDVGYRVKLWFG